MAITLQRALRTESAIEPKLMQLAQQANALMGQVSQAKAWADDILTEEHRAAGLILDEQGEAISVERLALYRAAFVALDALRQGANAAGQNGAPSVGALIRAYL